MIKFSGSLGLGETMTHAELDFVKASPVAMRTLLDKSGCVLLRGMIPVDRVERYRDALDAVYQRYDESPADFVEFPEAKSVAQGDVSPKIFAKFSGVAIEALFDHPKLEEFMSSVLGPYLPTLHTFMSVGSQGKAIPGLNLHTDGIIQGTDNFVGCLWAPLHPCGIESPGLSVVPAPRQAVLKYLQRKFPEKKIPGWSSTTEWNDTKAFEISAITAEFGDIWKPCMNPGDVMAFTNWTIHGSNVAPAMTRRRSAAILRLMSRPTLLHRIVAKFRKLLTAG